MRSQEPAFSTRVNCIFILYIATVQDKKLITRWDRRTLRQKSNYRLNLSHGVKLYHSYTQLSRNLCLSHRHSKTFLIIVPNYCTYATFLVFITRW